MGMEVKPGVEVKVWTEVGMEVGTRVGVGQTGRWSSRPLLTHQGLLLTTLYLPTSCLNSPCNFERLHGVGAAPWNLKPGSRRSLTGAHPGRPGEHSRGSQMEHGHS